ncbi:MAG: biotin/lipoyl-containing protein, partial [Phycisphaerales bacterium]
MPINVTMPRLSDTMEQGTVVKWHVKPGDRVSSGQVIADIETDKATMEQAVFDDGTIARLLCPEGRQVKVGEVIAVLAEEGENVDAAASAPASAAPAAAPAARNPGAATAAAPAAAPAVRGEVVADVEAYEPEGARARVSPVARRMAQEMGIDLSEVAGSGPGGRVIKRDILVAAENRGAAAPAARSAPAQGLVAAAPTAAPAPAATAAGAITPRMFETGTSTLCTPGTIAPAAVAAGAGAAVGAAA